MLTLGFLQQQMYVERYILSCGPSPPSSYQIWQQEGRSRTRQTFDIDSVQPFSHESNDLSSVLH